MLDRTAIFGIQQVRPGLLCDKHQGTVEAWPDHVMSVTTTRWASDSWPGTYVSTVETYFDMIPGLDWFDCTDVHEVRTSVIDDFGDLVPLDHDQLWMVKHSFCGVIPIRDLYPSEHSYYMQQIFAELEDRS